LARPGKKFGFLAEFEWNLALLIKAHPYWLGFYKKVRTEFKKKYQTPFK